MQAVRVLLLLLLSAFVLEAQTNQPATKQTSPLSISGIVLRADTRAPLAHVQVSLNGSESGTQFVMSDVQATADSSGDSEADRLAQPSGTMTDDKGHFTIANLTPGTYMLRASRIGMVQKNGGELGTIV